MVTEQVKPAHTASLLLTKTKGQALMQAKTNNGRIHFSEEQFVQVMLLKPQVQHSKEMLPQQTPL